MLFVPGNNPGMIQDAGIYKADCIMFDLEDSVSVNEKDSARSLVFHALNTIDYCGKELVVRVNDPRTLLGKKDLEVIVSTGKAAVRLPKTECADDVTFCADIIGAIEKKAALKPGSTGMIAAIESAAGVLNAKEIAFASERLMAIALGAEDFITDLKTSRSEDGIELFFARSMILLAARAAGIDALDTVFTDVNNEEGFRKETELIRQMGFDGKSIINPRQINIVHELFTPADREINHAFEVLAAIKEAEQNGSGVVSLKGRMIDKPIVERAQRILDIARVQGLINNEENTKWQE